MRNLSQFQKYCLVAIGALLLSGCGGGGGGGFSVGIDGSGEKPQQVSATGPINGFGSVIVNGVHYDTDNAQIFVRGEPAEEMALSVGDYVVVVGEVDENGDAIASEVHYQPRVTGDVEAIDKNLGRLIVMGQAIQLVEDTAYSSDITPRNIEGFEIGQKVSVSGVSDAQNIVRATRIELSEFDQYEALGAIEDLDEVNRVFYLDDLKVDYNNVVLNANNLEVGKLVSVSGPALEDRTLVASTIRFNMDVSKLQNIDSVEFTGFVKSLDGSKFFVDALAVDVTSTTDFKGGDRSDLSDNDKVRIRGTISNGNALIAEEIEYLPSPDMQVYDKLQSIVPASWGSPYLGTIQVADHVFRVKFDTVLDGDQGQRISFHDLRVGDTVYVSGYSKNGTLYTSSLSVDNREFENYIYVIQGFAYAVVPEQNSFFLFNTRVIIDEETEFGNGFTSYSERDFFALINSQYVQVTGYFDPERFVMVATRINFPYVWYGFPPPPPPMY